MLQVDNLQHVANLANDQDSKNFSAERLIWLWDSFHDRYVECYGRLRANMLFLFEMITSGNPNSNSARNEISLFGAYVLERFRIVDEPDSEALICDDADGVARHALGRQKFFRFSLLFVDSGESVRFAADSSLGKSEWIAALSKASTNPDDVISDDAS